MTTKSIGAHRLHPRSVVPPIHITSMFFPKSYPLIHMASPPAHEFHPVPTEKLLNLRSPLFPLGTIQWAPHHQAADRWSRLAATHPGHTGPAFCQSWAVMTVCWQAQPELSGGWWCVWKEKIIHDLENIYKDFKTNVWYLICSWSICSTHVAKYCLMGKHLARIACLI